jgi:hypothetical protein
MIVCRRLGAIAGKPEVAPPGFVSRNALVSLNEVVRGVSANRK